MFKKFGLEAMQYVVWVLMCYRFAAILSVGGWAAKTMLAYNKWQGEKYDRRN